MTKTRMTTMMMTMMIWRERRGEDMKKDMTQMRRFKVGDSVGTYLPILKSISLPSSLLYNFPSLVYMHNDATIYCDTPFHESWRI